MHDTAFRIGTLAMNTYADLANAAVLEIGSQIVNGSLRSSALPTTNYVGLDIEQGDGVDFVIQPGQSWPVDDDRFDLVMATSVFEHDTAFWRTFLQMCRKAKPGGHIYISAPSNGKVHRYPQDYWRFYPDAGLALKALAESEGIQITLVESFVAEREQDEWNDFCAIFRRGPCLASLSTDFIYQRVACTNALTWQSPDVVNARENSEDQVLLWREHEQLQQLHQQREGEKTAWNAEREFLARGAAEAKIAEEKANLMLEDGCAQAEKERESFRSAEARLQGEIDSLADARETAERRLAELNQELKSREHRIADLENNLRQRQEEISQAWTQLETERTAKDGFAIELQRQTAEIEELGEKLQESDEWVFKLAGARRQAEQLNSKYETELKKEKELRLSAQSQSLEKSKQLGQVTKAQALDESRLERSHHRLALILDKLREREVEVAETKADAESMAARLARAEDELEGINRELSILNRTSREQELLARQKERQVEWLRLVDEVIAASTPGWRGLMPPAWRRRRQLRALRNRGLFDSAGYLERYPDVADAGIDPLSHYILHGMSEGRQVDINLG